MKSGIIIRYIKLMYMTPYKYLLQCDQYSIATRLAVHNYVQIQGFTQIAYTV